MTEIRPGRRYRITETYASGTVVTYEGRADYVERDSRTVELPDATAWGRSRDDVTVTVEELREPLPTTPGSVVRVAAEDGSGAGTTYMLVSDRVTRRKPTWVGSDWQRVTLAAMERIDPARVEVLYVAPEAAS